MPPMSASYQRDRRAMGKADGGLLPFQKQFVDAVCRVKNPPEICGGELASRIGQVVAVRRSGSAVADAG